MYVTQYCPGSGNCYSRLPACFLCIGFGTVSAETLRVGMVCAYAPFNYKTAEGELAGYGVDVAKDMAELVGADLAYVFQCRHGNSG
ncbi:transporter substrate-binding domain-containing protein [Candidatus Spongiihabitans sp.]|uniref:transporter substrate-binding domain-containing protein n=1 Tax=Candidatus Spongiihabitans sp. TaxID=3101308 RepID=UPI003C6F6215